MSSPNAEAASRRAVASAAGSSRGFVHQLHALAAAARRRLDQHRVADLGGRRDQVVVGQAGPRDAGHDRHIERRRPSFLAVILSPIASIALAGGPMNTIPAASQRGGEIGVLGEEPVARVDRLGAGAPGGVEHRGDVEVALPRAERARCATAASASRTWRASASASL